MNKNFFNLTGESNSLIFIREVINVLAGIIVLYLIIKLFIFLVKYIISTAITIITSLLKCVGLNAPKFSDGQKNRPSNIKKEEINSPEIPENKIPTEKYIDEKYKGMSIDEIKREMNKLY